MKIYNQDIYLEYGHIIGNDIDKIKAKYSETEIADADKGSIASRIIDSHNLGNEENLKLRFDALASHDITYVGIVQTARYSGLKEFPVPYVLTNCHNSLCAVGGTINEDDHLFGLSAAKKFGGIYVPPHVAVIHQYMREMFAGCGKMILGSDSHTRYGALGTMAIGEGGPELVKQILKKTYDVKRPDTIAVVLTGTPKRGVGPQDVALALIGKVFADGIVKNKVLEFVGPGIQNISMDYRIGIDVMTTESACLSSIWETDEKTEEYLAGVGRESDYKKLEPRNLAKYEGAIEINLSEINPMIAMPFHPSNTYEISDVIDNPIDILREVEIKAQKSIENPDLKLDLCSKVENGKVRIDQGIIAGCAGGGFENLYEAAAILNGSPIGNDAYSLSIYPASMQVYQAIAKCDVMSTLISSGAIIKTAFCGPCFGAGDVPANNALSIRHTTRNFPQREGSKPSDGQLASVALMDARSIAATSRHKGILTPATELEYNNIIPKYYFEKSIYSSRIYNGYNKSKPNEELIVGPNIVMWPEIDKPNNNLLLKLVSVINDDVTTTDELIPSGETSSYRSNPMRLAEFTLSRKDPNYVERAKIVAKLEKERKCGKMNDEVKAVMEILGAEPKNTTIGSTIYATKPGDGSAREQAASCQRVLGASANLAIEYATKRYRSNLINWGMLPLLVKENVFMIGDYLYIKNVRDFVTNGGVVTANLVRNGNIIPVEVSLGDLTNDEKDIILSGCLMNYYREN